MGAAEVPVSCSPLWLPLAVAHPTSKQPQGGAHPVAPPVRGPLVRALRIGRASSPEQPELDASTPTGGVRLRRRLYLTIAAVRGNYTIVHPALVTLARRAAPNPPARAARAAALRGLCLARPVTD